MYVYWEPEDDAPALQVADLPHGPLQWKKYYDRLRRGNTDCHEGKGWSPKPVDIICFTHYHADHISGLPGMLLTMGNAERTEPLLLIGPKGLTRVVNSLRVIAPELPFPIEYMELTEPEHSIDFEGFRIEAFRVNHNVVCYGYSIIIERSGRFQLDKARH